MLFHPELPLDAGKAEKKVSDGLAIAEVEQKKNPNLFAHDVQHPVVSNEIGFIEMVTSMIRKFCPNPIYAPHVHFVHVSSPDSVEIIENMLKARMKSQYLAR